MADDFMSETPITDFLIDVKDYMANVLKSFRDVENLFDAITTALSTLDERIKKLEEEQ